MKERFSLKQMILLALFSSVALICVFFVHIPVFEFLEYDPKDIFITLGGLILRPWTTVILSVAVSFLHTFTIGAGGVIGFIMESLASIAYCLPVCMLYHEKKRMSRLYLGFVLGGFCLTIVMIVWNIFLTPVYLGVPREAVMNLIWVAILPFNLGKSCMNSLGVLLLNKPVMKAMRMGTFDR